MRIYCCFEHKESPGSPGTTPRELEKCPKIDSIVAMNKLDAGSFVIGFVPFHSEQGEQTSMHQS